MIEQGNLSLPVYQKIKEMILNGTLKPGQKLKQEHLAIELGVSRTPLHKAFQMLENEFFVESIPRRGYFVKEVNLNEVLDAFECREALEGIAARRAAKVITKTQIEKMKSLFKPFLNTPKIDLKKYQKADHEFHQLVITISGNTVLKRLDILASLLHRTYQKGLIRGPEETLPEHFAIIDAFERKNSEDAEQLAIEDNFKYNRNR